MDGYVALGSNLGDRLGNLRLGIAGLLREGIGPLAESSVWETEPLGTTDPHWFLNMVVRIATDLPPMEILDRLLAIERDAGRVRTFRNAPRSLDLDLLSLGTLSWNDERLVLPHPRMWARRFVLEPLGELAPDLRHPATGQSVEEVCRELGDRPAVRRIGPVAPRKADPV